MRDAGAIVAIVDDDDTVRRALSRLVRSLSYQPVGFASGEDFLASLGQSTPSCVLFDLHMPGLNGLDVLHRLHLEGRQLPAIIITGFDQAGLREKCLEAGAFAYLVKPLERSAVASVLEAALAA